MSTCQITRDSAKNIVEVTDSLGNPSRLYQQALAFTDNPEMSANLVVAAENPAIVDYFFPSGASNLKSTFKEVVKNPTVISDLRSLIGLENTNSLIINDTQKSVIYDEIEKEVNRSGDRVAKEFSNRMRMGDIDILKGLKNSMYKNYYVKELANTIINSEEAKPFNEEFAKRSTNNDGYIVDNIDNLIQLESLFDDTEVKFDKALDFYKNAISGEIVEKEMTLNNSRENLKLILGNQFPVNEIVDTMIDTGITYGYFEESAIYLSKNAPAGTEYHEAFHAVFRTMLSDKQAGEYLELAKQEMGLSSSELKDSINQLRKTYPNLTDSQLENLVYEEYMADSYMDFAVKEIPTTSALVALFNLIKNFVLTLMGNRTKIQSLYYKLNNRGFKQAPKQHSLSKFLLPIRMYKNLIYTVPSVDEKGKSSTKEVMLPANESLNIIQNIGSKLFALMEQQPVEYRTPEAYKAELQNLISEQRDKYLGYSLGSRGGATPKNTELAIKHLKKEGIVEPAKGGNDEKSKQQQAIYDEMFKQKQQAISDRVNKIAGALNIEDSVDDNGNIIPNKNMETFWNTLRGLYAAVPNNPFARSYASVMAAEAVDSIYKDDVQGNDDIARFDMSANEKGGFDIISTELKQFYSLLTKEGYDDFLLSNVDIAVDGQALHGTLISALSNRDCTNKDVYDTLLTMSKLSGNEDVKALLDKVDEYSKLNPDAPQGGENVDYNSQIINQLRSAYQLYDKQRDSMLVDSNQKAIQKVSDNNMVSEQLDRWSTMWGYSEDGNKGLSAIALANKVKYGKALEFMQHSLSFDFSIGDGISLDIKKSSENVKMVSSVLSGATTMTFEQFFNVLFGEGKKQTGIRKYLESISHEQKDLVPSFQSMFGIDMSQQTAHLLIAASQKTEEYANNFDKLITAHEANAVPTFQAEKAKNPDLTHKQHIAKAVSQLIVRAKFANKADDAKRYNYYDKEVADASSLLYELERISALNSVFDNRYSEFSIQTADGQTVYSFMLDAYNARSVRELGKDGLKKLKNKQAIRRGGKLAKYGNSVVNNYFVKMDENLQKAIFTEDNDSKPIDAGDIRQDSITKRDDADFVDFNQKQVTESKIGKTAKSAGNKEYMLLRVGNFASRKDKQVRVESTDKDGNTTTKTVTFQKAKYIPGVYEAKNQIELKSLPVGVYDNVDKEFKQFLDKDALAITKKEERDRLFITEDGTAAMYQLFEKELEDMNSILTFVKDNIGDYKKYVQLSNAEYFINGKNIRSGELIEYFNTLEAKAQLGYEEEVNLLNTYKESEDESYKAYTSLLEIRTKLGETENHLVDGFHISLKNENKTIDGVKVKVPVVKLGRAFDNWNFKFAQKASRAFAKSHEDLKTAIEERLTAYFYSNLTEEQAKEQFTFDDLPQFTDFLNNEDNKNEKTAITNSIVEHLKEDYDKAIAAFIEEGLLSVDKDGKLVNELLPIPKSYIVEITKTRVAGEKNLYVVDGDNTYKVKDLQLTILAFVQDMVMNQFFNVTNYNNMVDIHPAIAKNAADRVKRYGGHVAYGKRSLEGFHTVAYVEQINLLQDDLYTIDESTGKIIYGSDFIKKKVSDYINEKYTDNNYDVTNIGKDLLEEALVKTKLYEEEQANGQAYVSFERTMDIKTQRGFSKKEVVNSSFQVLENGDLSVESISPIAKIRFGLPLTWSEKSLLEENNLIFNSIKGVYYDAERYHKLSYAILTRELTSYLPKENAEQAKNMVNEILILEERARRMYGVADTAPEKKVLLDRARNLEVAYEDLFKALPGRLKSHNLRRAMFAQKVDEVLPKSASKLNSTMLAKPQDASYDKQSTTYDFSYNREVLANDHWALQVEMPTGKTMVTYFTQMISLIDNEQTDEDDVVIKGMKLTEIKAAYQKALSDRVKNAVEMALSELTKMANDDTQVVTFEAFDESTLVDYENLIGRLQETLLRSGADDSLLEFFKLDSNNLPLHDVNSFSVEAKFQQLFNAMFSDGVMKAKSFGRKMSLISDYGFNVVRDENDKVVPMKTVLDNPEAYASNEKNRLRWSEMKERLVFKDSDGLYRNVDDSNLSQESKNYLNGLLNDFKKQSQASWSEYLSENTNDEIATLGDITVEKSFGTAEIMMPAHTRELYNLKIGDEIPSHLLEGFGVRIPTQDKHSMISFIVVDFLPVYMGDVAICPTEICSISGADYDIDSLYTLLNEYYTQKTEDGKEELVSFNSMPREDESADENAGEEFEKYTDRLYKEYLTYQEMYNSNYARIKSMVIGEDYEYNEMKAEYEFANNLTKELANYKELFNFDNSEKTISKEEFYTVFKEQSGKAGFLEIIQKNKDVFAKIISFGSDNEFANIVKNQFSNIVNQINDLKDENKSFKKFDNEIAKIEKQIQILSKDKYSYETIFNQLKELRLSKLSSELASSKENFDKAQLEFDKVENLYRQDLTDKTIFEVKELRDETVKKAFTKSQTISEISNLISNLELSLDNDSEYLTKSLKDERITFLRKQKEILKSKKKEYSSIIVEVKALSNHLIASNKFNILKAAINKYEKAKSLYDKTFLKIEEKALSESFENIEYTAEILQKAFELEKEKESERVSHNERKKQILSDLKRSIKLFNKSFSKKYKNNFTISDLALLENSKIKNSENSEIAELSDEGDNLYTEIFKFYNIRQNFYNKSKSEERIQEFDAKKEELELFARKKARIYADKESFVNAWKATGETPEVRRDMNNASVGNALLRINSMLYSNSAMEEIALTPSSMDLIDNQVGAMLNDIMGTEASSRPLNTVMGQTETKHANAVGKILIGPAAITNITKALLSKYFRQLQPKIKGIAFEDASAEDGVRYHKDIGGYETTELSILKDKVDNKYKVQEAPEKETTLRTMDIISTILSAATDNVKNNGMANMRFDINLLPSYLYMVSLGTGLNRVGLISAQPVMKLFSKFKNDERPDNIQTTNQRIAALEGNAFSKAIGKMVSYLPESERISLIQEAKRKNRFPSETTLLNSLTIIGDISKAYNISNDIDAIMKKLAEVLKANSNDENAKLHQANMLKVVIPTQVKALTAFNGIKSEVSAFTRASKLIGLNKGLKPTHFENNMVEDAIAQNNPFLRETNGKIKYNLLKDTPSLQSNFDTLTRIVNVFASKVCTSQTPFVKQAFLQLRGLFGVQGSTPENLEKLQSEFTHFLQLKAYLYRDQSTTNQFVEKLPLLFSSGADGMVKRLSEIVAENPELSTNAFIKSLSNSFRESKNDASNGLNIVRINSRFKESSNVINKKINAFEEMLYSPKDEVKAFAKDLVDYLILKDGLNYKNGSYLKYVPASALQDLSNATKRLVLEPNILGMQYKGDDLTNLLLKDSSRIFEQVFGVTKQTLIDEFIYSFASQESNSLSFTTSKLDKADKEMIKLFKEQKTALEFLEAPIASLINDDLFYLNDLISDVDRDLLLNQLTSLSTQYYENSPLVTTSNEGKSFTYEDVLNQKYNVTSEMERLSKEVANAVKDAVVKNKKDAVLKNIEDYTNPYAVDKISSLFRLHIATKKREFAAKVFGLDKTELDDDSESTNFFDPNFGIVLPRVIVTQYTNEDVRRVYIIKEYESDFDVLKTDYQIAYYDNEASKAFGAGDKETGKYYKKMQQSMQKYRESMLTHVLATKATYELVGDDMLSGLNPFTFSTFEERKAAHNKLIEIRTANANRITDEQKRVEALKAAEEFKNKTVVSGKINKVISGGNLTDNDLNNARVLISNKNNANALLDSQIEQNLESDRNTTYSKLADGTVIKNLTFNEAFTEERKNEIDAILNSGSFIITNRLNIYEKNSSIIKMNKHLISSGATYFERNIGKERFGFWYLPQDNVIEDVQPDLFKALMSNDFGTMSYLNNIDPLKKYYEVIRATKFRTNSKIESEIKKVNQLNDYREKLLFYTDNEYRNLINLIDKEDFKGFIETEKEYSKKGLKPNDSQEARLMVIKQQNKKQLKTQLDLFKDEVKAPEKESINQQNGIRYSLNDLKEKFIPTEDAIRFVRKDSRNNEGYFEEFSNFTASDKEIIDDLGLRYKSVEAYYQAQKTLIKSEREQFTSDKLKIPSQYGNIAKNLGQDKTKKITKRPDWDKVKYDVMREGLRQKFQNASFMDKLKSTGNKQIIEWTWWGDEIWGMSQNKNKGSNALGKLLMELRDNQAPEEMNNQSIAESIYNKLGNKTESENVKIEPVYQQAGANYAKSINGVFSMRVDNMKNHFGNPFSSVQKEIDKGLIATKNTKESVVKYTDWVINSEDDRATWIREVLKSGQLKGKPVVYYKELGEPSHATALDYLINKYDWGNQAPEQENINNQSNTKFNYKTVAKYYGYWDREEVEKQTDKVFLFDDNSDDKTNRYTTTDFPQAVIRGLPNAIGINTKKDRGTNSSSYFTDADLLQFKQQVDEAIQKAKTSGKVIVIPANKIGEGVSMLEQKAPKLFEYLQKALDDLYSQPAHNHNYTFKGYVSVLENKSTNNWYGDAKDEMMREVSGGFIGEGITAKSSVGESALQIHSEFHDESSHESQVEDYFFLKGKPTLISGGTTHGQVVMLARDDAFSNKPLDENTKQAIKESHKNGAIFVVGDMPNVDTQFIDYLKEIRATFEIYHTGDKPRIIVDKAPEQEIDTTDTSISSGAIEPKLLKNEDGLIIIENAIPLEKTIEIVESSKDLITQTSFKQTQGSVSWGWRMQWLRLTVMTPEQKKGLVIGKQLNGKEITQSKKDNFIATGDTKGMPLYAYTTVDRNGKTLPNIPSDIIELLLEKSIDVSEYDASYNSVYDKADNGSLIIHQDNTENNKSPIITISLGRPMKFITYELNNENDFNMVDPVNTAYRTAVNTVEGEAVKLGLIPESAYDDKGKVKYGHLTPNTLLKYAKEIDKANANSKFPSNTYGLVEETLKAQFKDGVKTEYTLENGAILVFSGKNRNVLHEIVFDESTNNQPMPDGFPELTVNKALKGLGQKDKFIKTNDYRVVLTLRKVEGNTINSVNQNELLKSFPSGAIEQPQTTEPAIEDTKLKQLQLLAKEGFIEHKCF